MSAVVAALADPADEVELRRLLAVEFGRDGYRQGYSAGWLAAVAMLKRLQHGLVAEAAIEVVRWTVSCREHRITGYAGDCPRCEVRTRETFGQPHPDDYQGGAL